jgi:hypothetical protein
MKKLLISLFAACLLISCEKSNVTPSAPPTHHVDVIVSVANLRSWTIKSTDSTRKFFYETVVMNKFVDSVAQHPYYDYYEYKGTPQSTGYRVSTHCHNPK